LVEHPVALIANSAVQTALSRQIEAGVLVKIGTSL
jgi:hypothetical protein